MDIYSIGLNTSYGWISVEFGGALDFEECITYVTDHRDEYAVVTKCQHVLLILFGILSAVFFSRILFRYIFRRNFLRVQTLSRCMITYMSFTAVGMLFSVCRGLSFLALGMADGGMIDVNIYFIIHFGIRHAYFVVLGTLPLAVFFLALERCLAIQLGARFSSRLKLLLFMAILFGSPGIALIIHQSFVFVRLWIFKMVIGILNFVACVFLFWKIRSSGATVSDTVVKLTSVLELCLECLPNLLLFIKSHFRLGFCIPYVDTLPEITQCLNSAICGLIYNKVLSARKDKVTTLTSSTTGNANNLSLAVPQATLNVANKSANVTHVTAISQDFCNSHVNNSQQ